MNFHIPFTVSGIDKLKRKPKILKSIIKYRKSSKLKDYLESSETDVTREQYLNIIARSFVAYFISITIIVSTILALLGVKEFYLFAMIISLLFSVFVGFSQFVYPKIYVVRKEKDIERNLIPALEDILVQLNSGIPLFNILINISASDYGELSNQFKKIVRKINAGLPQIEVLEEIGEKSTSLFFRRTLWQISNGMKAGSDISIVIRNSVKNLSEEQIIQIQNYGNKLNPLIMFYMLISVILPALAITFLTIIASLISLPENLTILLYIGLFIFIIFVQIMFLGVVKSTRPTLI